MITRLFLSMCLLPGHVDTSCDEACHVSTVAAFPASDGDSLPTGMVQDTPFGRRLLEHELQISGWTEMTFTAGTAARRHSPMGFNDRANDFLLQQNWLRIRRPVNSHAGQPTFGFLSDTILPGSDYRFTVARGLADRQSGTYGFDPVQFYAHAYFPNVRQGLDVKLGRFFGQYGVESIAGADTPFVSRAYTFIYNPFTHTGVLATLQLNESWSIQNGLVTGSDIFIDSGAEATYIGRIGWAPPDSQNSLSLAAIVGPGRYNLAKDFEHPQVFNLVCTHGLNPHLTYTFDALFGYQTNLPDIGTATWFGTVNYLTREISPSMSATTRLELFHDRDGNRTGFAGLYTAATGGMSFRPRGNIALRPEIRFDHNNQSRAFDDKHKMFTAAFDVILFW